MDPKKDLNVSGNRIVNVADPRESDHVATRHYVDHLHIYRPDSNAEEYVRYINARNVTLHSIAGLCTLETTFGWVTDPKRTVFGMVDPYIVLESTTGHCLFVIQEQDLTEKSMTGNICFLLKCKNGTYVSYLKLLKIWMSFIIYGKHPMTKKTGYKEVQLKLQKLKRKIGMDATEYFRLLTM